MDTDFVPGESSQNNPIRAVSIVIPAFNEEEAVAAVVTELRAILQQPNACVDDHEIIVVDDGSTDATASVAQAAGARVIRHRSNRGYGASLKTGITVARYEAIAITDADGTYPIVRLPDLLRELTHVDMVVGARIGQDVSIPWLRRPAKWILRRLANYVAHARIPDLNSGLRVFRRDVAMQYFPILPDQFSWTTTITLAMHCDSYTVSYVPINYHKRQGRSKIVPWDAGSFAILILRTAMLYRPLRVFLPMAVFCWLYGLTKMGFDLAHDPNISASALLALMSGLQIILIGTLGDAMTMRLGRLRSSAVFGVRQYEVMEMEHEPASEESVISTPAEE